MKAAYVLEVSPKYAPYSIAHLDRKIAGVFLTLEKARECVMQSDPEVKDGWTIRQSDDTETVRFWGFEGRYHWGLSLVAYEPKFIPIKIPEIDQ